MSNEDVTRTSEPSPATRPRQVSKDPDTAVALRYDPNADDLPRVVAKGHGAIAEQILAVAEAHGVPIRKDRNLVEVLDRLDINAPIPVAAFAAVAEILAHLYRVNDDMSKEKHDG